ncbi:MAG: hypothetical protein C4542_08925 [Dehalococcoidia bacterium]|nr:MAG: hypothetical protein C4542_08925 [Dehalococcoidia bacterium]
MRKKQKEPSRQKLYDAALSHIINSNEDPEKASQRSRKNREPLLSPEVNETKAKGKIVPHKVSSYRQRLEKQTEAIAEAFGWWRAKEREASPYRRPVFWLALVIVIVAFDGALLGPVIAELLHTFESDALRYLVGLGCAFLVCAGGYGIGALFDSESN